MTTSRRDLLTAALAAGATVTTELARGLGLILRTNSAY